MFLLTLILLIAICSSKSSNSFPIKHFVVLMQENRAFDHFLGHLKKTNPNINGLNGDETNPYNPFNPNSKTAKVNFNSGPTDPNACHSVPCTTQQVFGGPNMTFLKKAPMNGFVANAESMSKGWGQEVMSCHNSETLPVLSTLANEFLVLDKWHASVPGPTEVNRAFIHSATSAGLGTNDVDKLAWGLDCDIFEPFLDDLGLSWGIFYDYFPTSLFMRKLRYYPENFHTMWDFEDICQSGNLPTFSFIEPRYFAATSYFPANDQHPDHDVYEGEKFYKWVYETLRASPQWNESALLIVYDEHGGYYDHVPTPLNVSNPDGLNSTDPPFDFTRLGVRVPAVLISPWVNKGTVEHAPKGPFQNSEYEHSSIIGTLRNVFGWKKNLTTRDAWAGTFEHLFLNRTTPRTDCPKVLPTPPKPLKSKFVAGRKLNSLQRSMVSVASNIAGHNLKEVLTTLKTEQEGGSYCAEIMKNFVQKKNKISHVEHEFL